VHQGDLFDSGIAPKARIMHLIPLQQCAHRRKCVQMMAATLKGEGDVAILIRDGAGHDQNIWIEEMKKEWGKPAMRR